MGKKKQETQLNWFQSTTVFAKVLLTRIVTQPVKHWPAAKHALTIAVNVAL